MKKYIFDGHKLIYHLDRVSEFLKTGDCFPLYMEVSPVGSCNHRCLFCAYDFIGYPNRRLKTEPFLSFLDEAASCGLRSILYAGEGEPLLHPDITKFISYTKKKGIDVGIYTNGHLLKEEIASSILPDLTFMRISFNGGTAANYASIHNVKPSVFDEVLSNIRKATAIKSSRKLDVDIGVQYVLLPENMRYLVDGIKAIKEAGADYFAIKPFVQQSPRQHYQMVKRLDAKEVEGLFDEAEGFSDDSFRVIARKASFEGYGKRGYKHCYGTSFVTTLNSAGEIASCLPYWDKPGFVFGNIYEDSFRNIWGGEKRRKIKAHLEGSLDAACCSPNCRPHAVNEFLWEAKHPSSRHCNFV